MNDFFTIELGLILLASLGALVFRWGFRHLPSEAWQIALAVPARTNSAQGRFWPAINFTFYGVISAVSYGLSVLMFVFLVGATGQSLLPATIFITLLLAVGIPASKLVARWVEGTPGHTIGGAVFAVLLAAAPAMTLTELIARYFAWPNFDTAIIIAAASIAYVLGEAIGRLACLSFGCCYGRPIAQCTSLQKALYSRFTDTYRGRFKKIAYAGGLNDRPVIAVQSIASAVLFVVFLIALWFFWKGRFAASIVVALGASQLWRAYSEQLRADFRGREGFTLYQAMAIIGALLSLVFARLYASAETNQIPTISAHQGWLAVIQVEVIVASQSLALWILLYMGRSSVTSSRLELFLHEPAKK
jgi:Prolipoprotein diacylglyceryl transferase